MLKAQDIRVVTFDKGMRGYNTVDVDAFLVQLADQMEIMEAQKAEIEKKLYMLAEKVAEYRKDENNLKAALLNAQRLGENVIQEANQRAAQILREADIKAEAVVAQTSQRLEEEKMELARLQEEVGRFKNNILALYRQHIESLSTLPEPPAPPVEEEPAAEEEVSVEAPNDLFAVEAGAN
jgi:cell division initiation protein